MKIQLFVVVRLDLSYISGCQNYFDNFSLTMEDVAKVVDRFMIDCLTN